MFTILVLLIGSIAILVMLLFAIVVIGIRQEPPMEELSEQAPSLTTVFVRRFLGVYVRKPDSPSRTTSLVGPMDKRNLKSPPDDNVRRASTSRHPYGNP